jgi:hypothetical protein
LFTKKNQERPNFAYAALEGRSFVMSGAGIWRDAVDFPLKMSDYSLDCHLAQEYI